MTNFVLLSNNSTTVNTLYGFIEKSEPTSKLNSNINILAVFGSEHFLYTFHWHKLARLGLLEQEFLLGGRGIVIYFHRGLNIRLNQLLELVFFACVVVAFVLLIPMKARATENKLLNRRGTETVGFNKIKTGERTGQVNELVSDRLVYVYDWSVQINFADEPSIGERE